MRMKHLIAATVLTLGTAFGLPALADDGAVIEDDASLFGAFDTVDANELEDLRGTHLLPFEWMEEDMPHAALSNNNAVNVHAEGAFAINIIDASFSGASGIVTIIQNVGNNVIIQTATMVTVNYHQ